MKMLNGAPKPPRAGTLMARREKEEEDQGTRLLARAGTLGARSIRTKSADGDALGSERAR
jgi:hypothetical protein